MRLEDLGIIGNCQFSALIHNSGTVVWCCLPRFDSEPLFSTLLDENDGGRFLVGPADGRPGVQRYLENTNILETKFTTPTGSFRVIDFTPRFLRFDRPYRPMRLFRIVEPLDGTPRIRVLCDPRLGWTKKKPPVTLGSNHLEWDGFSGKLRLTTDVPLSYLEGVPFALTERCHVVLTFGEPIEEPLPHLADSELGMTERYWQRWVKHCTIPPHYQREVIRSALALKLHCFEDTGAILASMTTSVPESAGSGRTWDYRYCWLRDAYYVLNAFTRLGHFEEREKFIHYLLNIAAGSEDLQLAPLYRIDGSRDLDERILTAWPGFEGNGPVRIGNGAAIHIQNDIFGEMVLALTPMFLDERFRSDCTPEALKLVERLARKAIAVAGTPDAGIWEYRTEWKPQTFSGLMCWAGADRMAQIAAIHAPALKEEFQLAAAKIHEQISARAWNPTLKSFSGTYDGADLDASLLQLANLRFLAPNDLRLRATVDAIRSDLSLNGWLFRYRIDDGFGKPTVAFVICTFWLIEALAAVGLQAEAREIMDRVRLTLSPLGLMSEDYETSQRRMWGNFPQAYSHVGLINAAFCASPAWSDVL